MSLRVLIISPNWLGDCLMALPAVNLLAKSDVKIDVLTKAKVAQIWQLSSVVENIFLLEEGFLGILKAARLLKLCAYDQVYVLNRTVRASLITLISRRPSFVRESSSLSFLASNVIPEISGEHQISTYARILTQSFNEPVNLIKEFSKELVLPKIKLDLPESYICFAPGAARGPSKQWPKENFIDLGKKIVNQYPHVNILLLGSKEESSLCEEIKEGISTRTESMAGRTDLKDLAALVFNAKLLVSNDTGTMHFASIFNVPVVGIFGITDPQTTGPVGEKSFVVQKSSTRSREIARDSNEARDALRKILPEDVFKIMIENQLLCY